MSKFDEAAESAGTGGVGGPTAVLKQVGDEVVGTVKSVREWPHTKFGQTAQEVIDGVARVDALVVIETAQRNWEGVIKIPTYPKEHAKAGKPRDKAEDDGMRAIYANVDGSGSKAMFSAISRAVKEAGETGFIKEGGKLALKLTELKPTDKGNPAKLFQARYDPPAKPSAFDSAAASAQDDEAIPY